MKLKKFAPAILLLIIAPLIAEFLLGDFNVRQFAYLGIFIPLYGALALFVRELVRHSGLGWGSMLLLALCCGLIYEGIVNQTLFNPHYAGSDLLKYGFIKSLGTSFTYATFILTLHTVWSISTPIALAEGFAGERAKEPWLSRPLVIGAGLLALLGWRERLFRPFNGSSSFPPQCNTGPLSFLSCSWLSWPSASCANLRRRVRITLRIRVLRSCW